ncbi:hypothetical protein CRG98_040322 [Punica granatum]|uniref:Alpha/beta hydrolase fold-3 domain-containing protein n=1 Tax=Punica granatum TaxID=22663 RepID=A0A2I0I771_PUNGR|nr:hypothetical protein CRG98_040322 [Punica granatum]
MESEIAYDFPPMARIYKDGRVERLMGTATVPASLDEKTGVNSKDIVISPESGLSARLYIPKLPGSTGVPRKLSLLVYFHGGGFIIESTQSPAYHNYLNALVSEAEVVVVSVEYRRAPERPLPVAYDDCWAALGWVGFHANGQGPEEWLNLFADLDRVFLSGDSAGANIAHNIAVRHGAEKIDGIGLSGIILVHPFFWGTEPVGSESSEAEVRDRVAAIWKFVSPGSVDGVDDPLMNPGKDPKLSGLGCSRVLVWVAEQDFLKDRGWYYGEVLRKSGWGGEVEVVETKGENHVFHLFYPTCDNAVDMMKRVVAFLDEDKK